MAATVTLELNKARFPAPTPVHMASTRNLAAPTPSRKAPTPSQGASRQVTYPVVQGRKAPTRSRKGSLLEAKASPLFLFI